MDLAAGVYLSEVQNPIPPPIHVQQSAVILSFFEKMEKNNEDMDFTCKFNTYLDEAFFGFEPFCADLASKFAKSGLKCY